MIERYRPEDWLSAVRQAGAPHATQLHGGAAEVTERVVGAELDGARESELTSQVLGESEGEEMLAGQLVKSERQVRGRWQRRATWGITLVAVGAILGLVIVGFMKFINDPVDATAVKKPAPVRSSAPVEDGPKTGQLGGLYFMMTYPGVFDQVGQVKTSQRALEQYNLSSTSSYRRTITVEVQSLPSGGLHGDSSYRHRQIYRDQYEERAEKIGGEPVALMVKRDKTEQTLFWAHKDKMLTVAIVSTEAKDDVGAMMQMVMEDLRWRQ